MSDRCIKSTGTSPAAARKWLAAALLIVLVRAVPNVRYLIGRDQATYCVIGQGLLRGKLLYRDLWDNKPPGIFYIYTLIVKIFGAVMWSVGVVDILWLLFFSFCIFYFARRYLGNAGGAVAVVFYASRHCRQGYIHAVQPEAFLMLCVFGAWFLLVPRGDEVGESAELPHETPSPPAPLPHEGEAGKDFSALAPLGERVARRGVFISRAETGEEAPSVREDYSASRAAAFLVAGLVLGVAFWLKYNAVAFFPFLALVPFVDFSPLRQGSWHLRLLIPWKEWLRRMALVAAGFLFAVSAVLVSFYFSGAWPALKEIQFEVLPRYGAMAFHWNLQYAEWALRQTQLHLGIWWEAMPAIALVIALWRRELNRIAPFTLMAFAGYVCTAMQGRFHPYYFETCYPFFALFWAYVLLKAYDGFLAVQRLFVQRQWSLARGLLWALFAGVLFSLLPEEIVRTAEQYRFAADWWRDPEASYKTYYWQLSLEKIGDQMRVIDYLKANSQGGDQVYVWGTAPLVNFLSQRECPSRFVSNLGLLSAWAPESWRQELVRTLKAQRPRYIVVERNDAVATLTFTEKDSEQYLQIYPGLQSLLERDYEPAANYQDFEIYTLKPAAATLRSEDHGWHYAAKLLRRGFPFPWGEGGRGTRSGEGSSVRLPRHRLSGLSIARNICLHAPS